MRSKAWAGISLAALCAIIAGFQGDTIADELPETRTFADIEFVRIPPGRFLMGASPDVDADPDEFPLHRVTLTRGFWLGKCEVTKREWQAVMGTTPWKGERWMLEDPDSPAVYVSWEDAWRFARALDLADPETYFRLPTEAEWEYACRAGSRSRFHYGDDPDYAALSQYAWCKNNATDAGEEYAHVVGLLQPNAWGLYDMHGNVREWCRDWFDEDSYKGGAVTDPMGPKSGEFRVLRGGSWNSHGQRCRSALRFQNLPDCKLCLNGFRVAGFPAKVEDEK